MSKLEDEMLLNAARQLAKDVDDELVWTILVKDCKLKGWHSASITRFTDNKHAIDITIWIEENIKGAHHRNGRHFIFEDYKDASWFLLKWS